MGLQLCRMTKETSFGVFNSAGAHNDIFLPMGDAMTVRVDPQMWSIRDAGQGNRLIRMSVGRKNVGGALSTYLFPTQTAFMLDLSSGLTGSAPCFDLPSFTLDHIIYKDETCGIVGTRYLGCKFAEVAISCDDSDQGCLTMFKGAIIGSTAVAITLTDFPNPALSAYPADDPYQLYHTAENTGSLVIGGARTNYKSLSVGIKNVLKPFGGEQRFASKVGYFGRNIDFSATLLYKGNTDRADYEAGTKKAVAVTWDNGTHTAILDLGSKVALTAVTDAFPLDDYYMQTVSGQALVDPALSPATDLTVTTT
jgi:hypothetical protein